MTTYAIFCTPGYGHVNPTLALSQELVARGERVIYYLTENFRSAVEATGALFRLYESAPWKKHLALLASTRTRTFEPSSHIDFLRSIATIALENIKEIPALLEQMVADQVDCVLYDRMFTPGILTSIALHVPAIQLMPSFAVNEHVAQQLGIGQQQDSDQPSQEQAAVLREQLAEISEQLSRECERYNLPGITLQQFLGQREKLNIVFVPRAFQPAGETFDESYLFVGPSVPTRRYYDGDFPLERLDARPLLYISLGTAFNDQIDFYRMCFAAFAGSKWLVVLCFGTQIDPSALGEPPANFLIAPHVPQLEVLARAVIFVSHGGMNSTMESLWSGVPLVVVPQMLEQAMNARRVQGLGLGLMLKPETLTAEQLRASVEQVAHDPAFHTRVQEMQQEMQQSGGYKRAADEIMCYIQNACYKE